MSYNLLSPGHPQPLDTLVALGLATLILDADPNSKVKLRKSGNYILSISTSAESNELYEIMLNAFSVDFYDKLKLVIKPQPALRLETIFELVELAEGENLNPFLEYQRPYHIISFGEGRRDNLKRREIESSKAYLQVAPWAGKYTALSYKSKERPYITCNLCAALAWYGIMRMASVIAVTRSDETKVVYSLPDIVSEVQTEDILVMSSIFGEKFDEIFETSIPILASPLITLASGETIYPLKDTSFDVFIWEHSRMGSPKTGQTISARNLCRVPLSPIMSFVAEAKARNVPLAVLLNYLLKGFGRKEGGKRIEGRPELLSEIVECLVYGNPDPYTIARNIWSLLSEEGDHALRLLSLGLVEAIFSVYRGWSP